MLIERQVDGRPFKSVRQFSCCPAAATALFPTGEGEPVARYFNARGFNCFVLRYSISTGEACFPALFTRRPRPWSTSAKNAEEYSVDENRVLSSVFRRAATSRRGFQTAVTATLQKSLEIDETLSRPNGQVLCYPVITSKKGLANEGSFVNLFGCEDFREKSELP